MRAKIIGKCPAFRNIRHGSEAIAWERSPGGEQKSDFCRRTCEAFAKLVDQALEVGGDRLVIVAHGGTQMAVMERFARPARDYFSWNGPNGGGFVLDASPWRRERKLILRGTVRYTKEGPECC